MTSKWKKEWNYRYHQSCDTCLHVSDPPNEPPTWQPVCMREKKKRLVDYEMVCDFWEQG